MKAADMCGFDKNVENIMHRERRILRIPWMENNIENIIDREECCEYHGQT